AGNVEKVPPPVAEFGFQEHQQVRRQNVARGRLVQKGLGVVEQAKVREGLPTHADVLGPEDAESFDCAACFDNSAQIEIPDNLGAEGEVGQYKQPANLAAGSPGPVGKRKFR